MRARIPCARPFGRFGCWMLSATSLCWAICWSSVRSPGRRTRKLAQEGVALLFACGPESARMAQAANEAGIAQCFYAADKNGLLEELLRTLQPGDAVLFKASRGMRFEELIESIYEGWKIK